MRDVRAGSGLAGLVVIAFASQACSSGGDRDNGAVGDAESLDDRTPDTEGDTDFVVDEGGDGRPDAVDGDRADVDSDGRDADAEVEVDGDGDGEGGLPRGCRFVAPTTDISMGWNGRDSVEDGKLVWRWIDESSGSSVHVLMINELAGDINRELLRRTYPDVVEYPVVHADSICFTSETTADAMSREVFLVDAASTSVVQLTTNGSADGYPIAGHDFVVYNAVSDAADGGRLREYHYFDRRDGTEHTIAEHSGISERAFDGHRWVAYTSDGYLYKFDLLDPGAGPQLVDAETPGCFGLAFDRDTGTLVSSACVIGNCRLASYDMDTDAMTILLDDPWDQVLPDVDGHVIVYEDSQAAGERYGGSMRSDLRILDRDTGAKRVVMPLDTYYGVGIWERWIAFNNYGMYGDSLMICDLVAGGHMTDDLHVVPE